MARTKKVVPEPVKHHLGEEGTEQFEVLTYLDGEEIQRQKIHDPFITTTVEFITRSRWEFFKHWFTGKPARVKLTVNVRGSRGAMSHIMQLDPVELQRETEALESGPTETVGLSFKEK